MAKFTVKVAITTHKDLTIYAKDEEEAEDKALELVSGWVSVEDSEVLDVTEE